MENFEHIELTQEEVDAALMEAKFKKSVRIAEQKKQEAANSRRAILTQRATYSLVKSLAEYRAEKIFNPKFIIDKENSFVFELLCRYFGEDKDFISMCSAIGVPNPSLEKGILLCGVFGAGKTWMMKLFSKNQRKCYNIIETKEIANRYKRIEAEQRRDQTGDKIFVEYCNDIKNAFEDPSVFYQQYSGWCFDDIGNEELKNSFGNKRNVFAEIIEMRYSEGNFGVGCHGTSNLTADQIEQYYGGRARSRMREMFNFIELPGQDRRK